MRGWKAQESFTIAVTFAQDTWIRVLENDVATDNPASTTYHANDVMEITRTASQDLKITIHFGIVKNNTITINGEAVTLTFKEFELLAYLMKNEGIVLSREKIMERVWGFDYEGESRTVDMHIKSLRQKLGPCGELIRTVRGVGYRLKKSAS